MKSAVINRARMNGTPMDRAVKYISLALFVIARTSLDSLNPRIQKLWWRSKIHHLFSCVVLLLFVVLLLLIRTIFFIRRVFIII